MKELGDCMLTMRKLSGNVNAFFLACIIDGVYAIVGIILYVQHLCYRANFSVDHCSRFLCNRSNLLHDTYRKEANF